MKLAAVLIALFLAGCDFEGVPQSEAIVREKFTSVSGGGGYGGYVSAPNTVYWLVSQSGMTCRVDQRGYIASEIGERVLCRWSQP
jgi:hypothetical protein